MKNALEEAIQLGHSYVGSEHLLLGILREVNCKAKEILEQVISDVEEIRIMIQEMLKNSTSGTLTLGHLPLTRRAERILRNTFAEALVLEEKKQIIQQTQLLEFCTPEKKLSDLGGLDNFKDWIKLRSEAFSQSALDYGLPYPKGLLLVGVQGTGKSIAAKIIANEAVAHKKKLQIKASLRQL